MKKLILATMLLAASTWTAHAQTFVAAKTEVGKDVVITDDKFYYTPSDGSLKVCKDLGEHEGKDDSGRPYYTVFAVCGKDAVAIKQYKDEKGGEFLVVINLKTEKTEAFPVIILKGDMI